jgi:hypothetical protein
MASRNLNFAYMSIEFFVNLLDVGYNGPYKPNYIFFWIFRILLEVHIGQFGITVGKHENSFKC